jgi:hypothetical protein
MENEGQARLDQRYMLEGWGEDCIGKITIRYSGAIEIGDVVTMKDQIQELQEELGQEWLDDETREHYQKHLDALLNLKAGRLGGTGGHEKV